MGKRPYVRTQGTKVVNIVKLNQDQKQAVVAKVGATTDSAVLRINFNRHAASLAKHQRMQYNFGDLVERMELIREDVRSWMRAYQDLGRSDWFAIFFYHWKIARAGMPLQLRLVCEQVFSDAGLPWSNLVTGFRPMGNP